MSVMGNMGNNGLGQIDGERGHPYNSISKEPEQNAVQAELEALGTEIKNLEEKIERLNDRLRFVMVEKPNIPAEEKLNKETSISPLGLGIRQKCNLVEDLRERVHRIIEDLEI